METSSPSQWESISVLYGFGSNGDLQAWMEQFAKLLRQFCSAENIRMQIV